MTDDQIKQINYTKRIEQLVDRFKLGNSFDDITNLKPIMLKILVDEFWLITSFYGTNYGILNRIHDLFDANERDDDPSYYINQVKGEYKTLLKLRGYRVKYKDRSVTNHFFIIFSNRWRWIKPLSNFN